MAVIITMMKEKTIHTVFFLKIKSITGFLKFIYNYFLNDKIVKFQQSKSFLDFDTLFWFVLRNKNFFDKKLV